MSTVAAILIFAALFAVFGLLRPRRDCGGDCGACLSVCHSKETDHG